MILLTATETATAVSALRAKADAAKFSAMAEFYRDLAESLEKRNYPALSSQEAVAVIAALLGTGNRILAGLLSDRAAADAAGE